MAWLVKATMQQLKYAAVKTS